MILSWPFLKYLFLCCALPRNMNMKCERCWEKLKREREDNCWCGNISSNSHVQREKSKPREESRRIWLLYLTFDKEGTKRGKDKERDVMEQKGERKCKTSRKKKRLSDKLKEWEMELQCIVKWINADSNISNRRRLETSVRRGFCASSLQQLWVCSFNSPHVLSTSLSVSTPRLSDLPCQLMPGIVSFRLSQLALPLGHSLAAWWRQRVVI